jgi:GMP synthase (glutamine-hydrolysing)
VSAQPLLVVEHEAQCPPGWLGEWLVEAGVELDVRRPYAGLPLPEDLAAHAGMLVLGGEMGAHDDATHPWLTDVKRLVVEAATTGSPVLGVCLGHQLAAVALGGEVGVNPLGQQIGVLGVGWTPAAHDDPLLGGVAGRGREVPAVQWNDDVVTALPPGAVDLAHTERGELQAARFAETVWGVQWHPEAGEEIIGAWADADRDAAWERGIDVDGYLADVVAARAGLRDTWRLLAEGFADLCRASRTAASPSGRS